MKTDKLRELDDRIRQVNSSSTETQDIIDIIIELIDEVRRIEREREREITQARDEML